MQMTSLPSIPYHSLLHTMHHKDESPLDVPMEGALIQLTPRLPSHWRTRRRRAQPLPVAVLPVVVTTTVDLSRLDPSLVTQISSFLGTSRELLSLALTCKSFGWRQPTSTLNWSLVEEVSRQAVCSRATDDEMRCLPRYSSGSTTWLSIHHRLEHLLMFDVLLGAYIGYRNWDKTAVCGTKKGDFCTAVSSGHVMRSGIHFAEFEIISGEPYIGIVRPMPSLDAEAYENDCFFVGRRAFYHAFLAQRSDDWGDGNVHACEYSSYTGKVCWTDWDDGDDGF